MVACKRNQVIHEQRERAEASDLAEQIEVLHCKIEGKGCVAVCKCCCVECCALRDSVSCYDDNERRPDNYYHDKANCDCPLCILDGREC
jgi:hypothetical protein